MHVTAIQCQDEKEARGQILFFYCCQFGWKRITQCCQKGVTVWFTVKSSKIYSDLQVLLQSCFIVPDTLAAVAVTGWTGAPYWEAESDRCTLHTHSLKYRYVILPLHYLTPFIQQLQLPVTSQIKILHEKKRDRLLDHHCTVVVLACEAESCCVLGVYELLEDPPDTFF